MGFGGDAAGGYVTMRSLFLVRHGQTDWNIEGRFQGRRDIPLNSRGILQAEAASGALIRLRFGSIWSSPLSRAFRTAQIIAEPHGCEVTVHDDLTEICHGEWEGLSNLVVADTWPGLLAEWHASPHTVTMPDGESLDAVIVRSVRALKAVMTASPGGNIVLVAHDAVLKVLICHLLNAPLSSFWRFRLENGSITVFDMTNEIPCLCVCGDTCHLGDAFDRTVQEGL